MVEIVNLNRARKARAKDAAKSKAAQNRAAFGRTRSQRALEDAEAQKARRELEGKKREE